MTAFIGRREFITLLGGAAVAWPIAAHAQQPERVRRIGVLMSTAENAPETQGRLDAFRDGLEKLGWMEGRNLVSEYRWGANDLDRTRVSAGQLVALKPEVIFAAPTSTVPRPSPRSLPQRAESSGRNRPFHARYGCPPTQAAFLGRGGRECARAARRNFHARAVP